MDRVFPLGKAYKNTVETDIAEESNEIRSVSRKMSRYSVADRMKSWLVKKGGGQTEELADLAIPGTDQGASDSDSSVDYEELQDERQKQQKIERDGQLIYLNITIPNKNKKQALQGSTLDNAATLAR